MGLVAGCSSPEVKPPTPLPPKTWTRGENAPTRWLLVHLIVAPERTAALHEAWRDAGVVFTNAGPGFVESGGAKDLNVILTGRMPSDGAETMLSPLAKASIRWRIMTDNPSFTFARQLKAAAPQSSQGLISSDVVGSLKTTLEEDWKFCLFSFDSRVASSNPNWEKDFFGVLASEEISKSTGVIVLTELPAPAQLVETFNAKPSTTTARARLSSKLKQSQKYELIFSRQQTGNRAHYISTHGISTKRPDAFAEAPEILTALEATFAAKGPDLIGVRSREAILTHLHSPAWFWTPQLKEASNKSATKLYWTDVAPYLAYSLGADPNADIAGEMFTSWVLRR